MDPRIPEPPESPRLFRPRTVGEILGHAFELYRLHWQNLVAIVAAVVVPLSVAQVLLVESITNDGRDLRATDGVEVGAAVLGGLVVAVISVLMWTVLTGAITRAAAGTFLGRDMDMGESYRYGLARFWSIVLVGLLAALAIAAGFVLLVIPGFFVLTRLAATLPALVIEDRRGTQELSRSWNLVAGHGWHVFGTIVVAGLITGFVSAVVSAPFGDNAVARAIAQSLASVVTMPYTALVGILIYLDLRVRTERYGPGDLEAELARTAAS